MTSSQGGLTDLQWLRHRNVAYEKLSTTKNLSNQNGNHWLTKRYKSHLQLKLGGDFTFQGGYLDSPIL